MSQADIIEAIRQRFIDEVAEPLELVVVHDNEPPKSPASSWCRFLVQPQDRRQASSGGASVRFRTTGTAQAQVFVPAARGDSAAITIAQAVLTAFTLWKSADPDVTVTTALISGDVARDEAWWRRTVEIRWRADEQVTT